MQIRISLLFFMLLANAVALAQETVHSDQGISISNPPSGFDELGNPIEKNAPSPAPAPPTPPTAAPAPGSERVIESPAMVNAPATGRTRSKRIVPVPAKPVLVGGGPAVISDRLSPGWAQNKFRYGIGVSGGFLDAATTIIVEQFDGDHSWSYFLGFSKAANTFTKNESSTTANLNFGSKSSSTINSGQNNPFGISIGVAYNKNLYQSEWLLVRYGGFAGLDYYTKASYDVGSRVETPNGSNPNTVDVTETGFGSATVTRDTVYKIGPVVDAFVMVRWLPQFAIGLQSGFLYATSGKTTTDLDIRDRRYQRISGVTQTPTTDTSTSASVVQSSGSSLNTFALGGTTFNLFGNFVLRYVW